MRVGSRSLLFGVHQFAWHPYTVARAWRELYGRWPNWKEAVCILVHDWGYWGAPNMDGLEGEAHPILGAKIVGWLFGLEYHRLVVWHSRHLARSHNVEPSELCWPDKLSIIYEPRWWYLFRARLSGEIVEYRHRAADAGFIPLSESDEVWFAWLVEWFKKQAQAQRSDVVPYVNPEREIGI